MRNKQPETIVAAAIQLASEVGDVATNLQNAEELCLEAERKGARLIALPEFFTSRIVFDQRVHEAVLSTDNEAVHMLLRLSQAHECWIGGSMLVADDGEIYNRYYFAEPDGSLHSHDKDMPTLWENAFYGTGHDDGLFETSIGGVGAAVCWELIRSQTPRRLASKVNVVMTGTHWWTGPSNWGSLIQRLFAPSSQYNRYMSENAPAELARCLGVPVIQASHCGSFRSGYLVLPGIDAAIPYDTDFVGCTQIVDAQGHVLAQRQAFEGPGVVTAEISLEAKRATQPIPDRFWIPDLPILVRLIWHHQNLCAKSYYRRKGRTRGLSAAQRSGPKAVNAKSVPKRPNSAPPADQA